MKKYDILKIITTLLVLTIGLTLAGCSSPTNINAPAHTQAEISPSVTDTAINSLTVRGTVESVSTRNVYSTLSFMVERVYATEGERVSEGQVLGILDTTDLELSIAQQRATLESTRQSTQNAVSEAQRMLNDATTNLSNNTNMHILNAEAALRAAETNLITARTNYENANRDLAAGTDPQSVVAESLFNAARIELERLERDHASNRALFDVGALSQEALALSESRLTLAQNQYNDARISYENAGTFQHRSLEQLRNALDSATTSEQTARSLLNASRVAARQDIERLRDNVARAEAAADLTHMEIALQLQERQLEESIITAPMSGAVTAVIAREGASGMGRLFIIEDTDNLRISTSFREYEVGMIEEGMEVIITSDAIGAAEYRGIINRISPAASPNSPIVEFEAEILVTSPNTSLRIGMNTRLSVIL